MKHKYIRTKNGVYDTTDMKWCVCSKQPNHYKDKNYMLYVPVKQADTIEELCDYFIFDKAFDFLSPNLIPIYEKAKKLIDECEGTTFVGYIVIEKKDVKTLEPVAKYNREKGALELL